MADYTPAAGNPASGTTTRNQKDMNMILNRGQKAGEKVENVPVWAPARTGSGFTQTNKRVTGTVTGEVIRAYGCSATWLVVKPAEPERIK